jgi:hypothetical protein
MRHLTDLKFNEILSAALLPSPGMTSSTTPKYDKSLSSHTEVPLNLLPGSLETANPETSNTARKSTASHKFQQIHHRD